MTSRNWTDINPTTKKAERFLHNYNESNCYRIEDAYKRPSCRKVSI